MTSIVLKIQQLQSLYTTSKQNKYMSQQLKHTSSLQCECYTETVSSTTYVEYKFSYVEILVIFLEIYREHGSVFLYI